MSFKFNPFTANLDKVNDSATSPFTSSSGVIEPTTSTDKLEMNNTIRVDMDMDTTNAGLIMQNTGYVSDDSWIRLLDDDGTEQFAISRRGWDAKNRVKLSAGGGTGNMYFYASQTTFQKSGGAILQVEGDNGDTHKVAAYNGNIRLTTRGLSGYGVEIGPNDSPAIYIPTGGNVGIGTDSPDTKLQVVGDTKLGDDNTNYASFATDGELTLVGTARVYKNQWINVQGLKAPGTKPATAVDWGIGCGWEFSDGTDDTICSSIRIPQDMDRTVAPELKIGFASDTNTGDVVWQLEYLYLSPNEDTTASAQETLTTAQTISATADGLTIATITGMDLPSATDQLIKIRIKRLGADGDDTLGDDCVLVGAGLKYVADKLGQGL